MKRVAFVFKVKPDRIEEYKRHHLAVWPEMQEALKRNGWHNYSLFLQPDGTVFGYFETPAGFQAALEGMGQEPINEKWQKLMAPFIDSQVHADRSMVELPEIFHLD